MVTKLESQLSVCILKVFIVALTEQADSDRLKSSELELYILELMASSGET